MIWGWPVQAWMGAIFLGIVALIGLRVLFTYPSKGPSVRPPRKKWK